MVKENKVEVRFSSIGENVALARMVLSAFLMSCDLTREILDEIKIALSEAVTNSIIHAYGEDASQMVILRMCLNDDILTLEIEDNGVGIPDIKKALEPEYSTMAEHMGLGFIFMKTFMDELEVVSEVGKGTKVILRRQLTEEKAISEVG